MTDNVPDNQIPSGAVSVNQLTANQAPQRGSQHSSQGGKHGPNKGSGPLGTWLVIGVLLLAIFLMWFLVLGIMEART